MNAYAKTPLKQIGNVVAWHEDRANRTRGDESIRHTDIANNLRSVVSCLFVERFNRGDYNED